MNFEYETEHLLLRVEHSILAPKVLEFYNKNRPYFDAWELTRPGNFYSEPYQKASLHLEYQEMVNRHFLRFWLYEKETYNRNAAAAPVIGSVSLSNIRHGCFSSAMLGYKLDHDYWGNGYGLEACHKLIEIAFSDCRLHRLEAFIMPANERSVRLIERLGFHYEGTDRSCIEVNHKFEDHLRYALLKEDFNC